MENLSSTRAELDDVCSFWGNNSDANVYPGGVAAPLST